MLSSLLDNFEEITVFPCSLSDVTANQQILKNPPIQIAVDDQSEGKKVQTDDVIETSVPLVFEKGESVRYY